MLWREAEKVDTNELLTLAGVFVGGVIAGLVGYLRPKRQASSMQDSVVTGVGLELGNRAQTEMVIAALHRIAAAIENKNQASLEDLLKGIHEDIEEMKAGRRPRG